MWKSWTNGDNMPIIGQTYPGIGTVLRVRLTADGEAWFGKGANPGLCVLFNQGAGSSATIINELASGKAVTLNGSQLSRTDTGILFPGVNGNFGSIASSPDLDLQAPYTILVRYHSSGSLSNIGHIIGRFTSGYPGAGYALYTDTGGTVLHYVHRASDGVGMFFTSASSAVGWHNAAIVVDATTGKGYLDGSLNCNDGSHDAMFPSYSGVMGIGAAGAGTYPLNVEIASIAIIPGKGSASEAATLSAHPYVLPSGEAMFEVEVANIVSGGILGPMTGILTPMGV